ncbi:hypothetical protein [Streptomyces sp. NPDC051994]|uniref:hypothetical protein n=1 Tax=unclassified Streptomyces TaxID=2593676 RepID=UPI0034180AD1
MTDTCPRCLTRGIQPTAGRTKDGQLVHRYRCRCGHQWTTVRLRSAYRPAA